MHFGHIIMSCCNEKTWQQIPFSRHRLSEWSLIPQNFYFYSAKFQKNENEKGRKGCRRALMLFLISSSAKKRKTPNSSKQQQKERSEAYIMITAVASFSLFILPPFPPLTRSWDFLCIIYYFFLPAAIENGGERERSEEENCTHLRHPKRWRRMQAAEIRGGGKQRSTKHI